MNDLNCPHCRNNVPRGATVCRGCQAEIKYGPADALFLGALGVGALIGFKIDQALPASMSIAGWIAGLVIFGGLSAVIMQFYKDRVVFKRIYRTR